MVSVGGHRLGAARARELGRQLDREPRMHGRRADGEQHRHPVDVEDVGGVDDEVGPAAKARIGQGRVDGAGREDRRERQPLEREAASVSSRISAPASDAATAARASRSRAASRPAGPSAAGQVASSRLTRRPPSRAASSRPSRSATTGRASRSGPRAARRPAEQCRSTAELHAQVHHDALALRVDRRVRDLGERLAEVVGDGRSSRPRPGVGVSSPMLQSGSWPSSAIVLMSRRARSASRPARWRSGAGSGSASWASARRPPHRRGPRTSVVGRRGSGSERSTRAFASVSSRISRRPGSTSSSSPGPRRPRRTVSAGSSGMAPASDATTTSRSRVTAKDAGRSPLRSTSAPTRTPSANTIAAGPSHGARNPAVRRRSVATCGCGARRSAERLGDRRQQRRRQVPAGRREQLERLVERERVGAVRREERAGGEQLGGDGLRAAVAGPAADLLAVAADGVDLAVVRDRAERLGEAPDRVRVRRVALVEDRVPERTAAPAGPGTAAAVGRPVTRPL